MELEVDGNVQVVCVLKRTAMVVLGLIIAALAAVGIDHLCHMVMGPTSLGTMDNQYWTVFFFIVFALIECAFFLRKVTGKKPEFLFLIIVLSTSVFFSWSLATWQYCWDDGIHYRMAQAVDVDGDEFTFSNADMEIINTHDPLTDGNASLVKDHSLDATAVRSFMLDQMDAEEAKTMQSVPLSQTIIEYITFVGARKLCTLLGVSFSMAFFLMKLPCALFYSLVTFFGMRRLLAGKMLYGVVALIPTSVFLTANYTYTFWTFSLLLYGMASFVGMMQRKGQPKIIHVILMLLAFYLGCLPRIVYFTLILICLCLPRNRFNCRRNSVIYRIAVLATALLTAWVFFGPIAEVGLESGDQRGGSNISSVGQLDFIANDIGAYAGIVMDFLSPPLRMDGGAPDIEGVSLLGGFLSFEALPGWLTNYGYLPRPAYAFSLVVLVLLVFTALTDTRKAKRSQSARREGLADPASTVPMQPVSRPHHARTANRRGESGGRRAKVHARAGHSLSVPSPAGLWERVNWSGKVIPTLIAWVACTTAALLIITYLYMMFTDVGAETISGVQRRYMLPLIYPGLAFLSVKKWAIPGYRVPAWIYNTAVLMIMAAVLLGSWWQSYLIVLN